MSNIANYHQEFKEYIKIIQKKTLRDVISQHYSTNEIKIGRLLSRCQTLNSKIKNWLITIYRACKLSKSDISLNRYLTIFKAKLSNISQKLLTELRHGEFNRVKLRKCAFTKKNGKMLPHDLQQLISEISCFISETIDEDSINIISHGLLHENSILKRKRFSRQLKESLIKYCKDFHNYVDSQDSLTNLSNPIGELIEVQLSFNKYDATLLNSDQNKKLFELELLLMDNLSANNNYCKKPMEKIVQPFDTIINEENNCIEEDFNDFDIVEEWNEDCSINYDFPDYVIGKFRDFISETNENVIKDIKSSEKIEEIKLLSNLDENNFINLGNENLSVSNLEQSYVLDISNKLADIIRSRSVIKCAEHESDCEDSLLRSKVFSTKPRPIIKILSLKKPDVYIDCSEVENSKEDFLKNIPLPDNSNDGIFEKANIKEIDDLIINPNREINVKEVKATLEMEVEEKLTTNTEGLLMIENNEYNETLFKETTEKSLEKMESNSVNEECDCRVEESILESILDFSEVLVDYFDCKENKEDLGEKEDNGTSSFDVIIEPDPLNDNVIEDCCIVNTPIEMSETDDVIFIGENIDQVKGQQDLSFSNNILYKNDTNNITRIRSNYSVYSPDKLVSNHNRDFLSYEHDNYNSLVDQNSVEMYEYRTRNYNRNNNSYHYNNQRYATRNSQHLVHNFLQYPTDPNEAAPCINNNPYRYRNESNYSRDY